MKIHFTSVLVLILATVLNVSRIELIALFLVVAMVITAELFNTSIEAVVNLVTELPPARSGSQECGSGRIN